MGDLQEVGKVVKKSRAVESLRWGRFEDDEASSREACGFGLAGKPAGFAAGLGDEGMGLEGTQEIQRGFHGKGTTGRMDFPVDQSGFAAGSEAFGVVQNPSQDRKPGASGFSDVGD